MIAWRAYAAVGLGTGLGSGLRHQVGLWLSVPGYPWATLAVNGLGSWLIAAFAAYGAHRFHGRVARWQPFLVAGFCGGFTTFSLFGLDTLRLFDRGQPWLTLGHVLANLALWLAAAWLGQWMGHRLALARG